jgi:hypothetical protein
MGNGYTAGMKYYPSLRKGKFGDVATADEVLAWLKT